MVPVDGLHVVALALLAAQPALVGLATETAAGSPRLSARRISIAQRAHMIEIRYDINAMRVALSALSFEHRGRLRAVEGSRDEVLASVSDVHMKDAVKSVRRPAAL